MKKIFLFGGVLASAIALTSCAEKASTGAPVTIPRVLVNCQTAQCRTNASPWVLVTFTTFGCQDQNSIDNGKTINNATFTQITCTGSGGCVGEITGWVDTKQTQTTTIASGTYSICVRIDYDRSFPNNLTGDTTGDLDNVTVAEVTSSQTITAFADP